MGTTSRDRIADFPSPPPIARMVTLNRPRGVRSLVEIVIVDVNECFADAGANSISMPAGTPCADTVTGVETPETKITDNSTESFDPRTWMRLFWLRDSTKLNGQLPLLRFSLSTVRASP